MSKFLKFIVNLVVICAILVAAALLVPPFAGVNTVMNDNSSKIPISRWFCCLRKRDKMPQA